MVKVRLHQFLSRSGVFENKKNIISAIKRKQIRVGEQAIDNENYRVDTKDTKIYYNDNLIRIKRKIYYLFNKPKGVNCQKNQKKSIYNLIKINKKIEEPIRNSLFTVGRLDVDTSGLIIITNDGELSSQILDPRNKIEKTYVALIDREISKEDIERLRTGVVIDLEDRKYKTRPAKVIKIDKQQVKIIIKEGKKRQIRRMFGALKYKVKKLKRVAIGNLELGSIDTKEFREVSKEDIYSKVLK